MFSKWPMHNVIKSCVDKKKKAIESKTQSKAIIVTEYEKVYWYDFGFHIAINI